MWLEHKANPRRMSFPSPVPKPVYRDIFSIYSPWFMMYRSGVPDDHIGLHDGAASHKRAVDCVRLPWLTTSHPEVSNRERLAMPRTPRDER